MTQTEQQDTGIKAVEVINRLSDASDKLTHAATCTGNVNVQQMNDRAKLNYMKAALAAFRAITNRAATDDEWRSMQPW